MPFQIIRNDITNIKADAIVNSANPEPVYSSGREFLFLGVNIEAIKVPGQFGIHSDYEVNFRE